MNKETIQQRIESLRQGAATMRANADRLTQQALRNEGAADELAFLLEQEEKSDVPA